MEPQTMSRKASGLVLAAVLMTATAIPAFVASPATAAVSTDPAAAPSGAYKLDPRHASVVARVSHMGFSNFALRFDRISGALDWDGADPAKSKVDVVIDATSVDTNVAALDKEVTEEVFAAAANPQIHFVSTKIERTGATTGKIWGDLTLRGVTKPVVLDAVFNGTAAAFGKPRMGFSAKGVINRADFGADALSQYAVGDVSLDIQAEFSQ
jgi:polyisoprenoid-binding protein YceI